MSTSAKGCATTLGAIVVGTALWYSLNSGPSIEEPAHIRYPLNPTMNVEYASYVSKSGIEREILNTDNARVGIQLRIEDVDFDKHFTIKTDRYNLVKDDDYWISRQIGVIGSLPLKFLLWDWDVGKGEDAERSRAVLAMLEYNKDVKDLTVRVNHNRVWTDLGRLFSDDKVTDRNNFLARVLLAPSLLFSELFAELSRTDYYNPMTQTVITYSNIEAIVAHEIGHHKDFQRFDSDWFYALTRFVPPVMVYQEWAASDNAGQIVSKKDDYQYNRYLVPALITYCLTALGSMIKMGSKFLD